MASERSGIPGLAHQPGENRRSIGAQGEMLTSLEKSTVCRTKQLKAGEIDIRHLAQINGQLSGCIVHYTGKR
jgi:hypothetical protein